MNEKNLDYLKEQVKYTGFGEALQKDLMEKMQKNVPEFQLIHKMKFGNDDLVTSLHFKRSEKSDLYFFNKYDLTLKQENNPDMMKQTFYINKGNTITLKEGYNLMSGRSINKDLVSKEGQVYNAWISMDFKETDTAGNYKMKHYHQNYGFDLEKELAKHPIKELAHGEGKAKLMESLQKGNWQAVTYAKEGSEQRVFIEANPQFKSLNVYDSNLQRLYTRQGQEEKQGHGEKQTAKQTLNKESGKQSPAGESEEMPKASNKRKKKQSKSIS